MSVAKKFTKKKFKKKNLMMTLSRIPPMRSLWGKSEVWRHLWMLIITWQCSHVFKFSISIYCLISFQQYIEFLNYLEVAKVITLRQIWSDNINTMMTTAGEFYVVVFTKWDLEMRAHWVIDIINQRLHKAALTVFHINISNKKHH